MNITNRHSSSVKESERRHLSQSLIAPFSNIGHLWAGLQRSLAAVMRIHEFFQIAKDRAIKQEVEQVPVNVEFRNVSFSY